MFFNVYNQGKRADYLRFNSKPHKIWDDKSFIIHGIVMGINRLKNKGYFAAMP